MGIRDTKNNGEHALNGYSPGRSGKMESPSRNDGNTNRDIRQVLYALDKKRKRLMKEMDELFFYLGQVMDVLKKRGT